MACSYRVVQPRNTATKVRWSMQSCAATWQAFSSQRALDFLRSQHFIAEGCAAASLSLAVMAASELSLAALQTGYLRAHHTNPVQAHRHHSCITGSLTLYRTAARTACRGSCPEPGHSQQSL